MNLFFAKITKPHSVHGEVQLNTKEHDVLKVGDKLYLEDGVNFYRVTRIKKKPSALVLAFEGLNSIDDVEPLRGLELFINTDELSITDDNSYYIGTIVGMKVVDLSGSSRGEVVGYYETKAHGILEVEVDDNYKVDIPFVERYIESVDEQNSIITVIDFDSLLDEG